MNLKSPYRGFYLANSLRDKELKGQSVYCGEGTNPARALAVARADVAVVEVHVPTAGSRCIRYLSLSRLITGGMPNK